MQEKILIVDDNELNVKLLREILQDEDYCVYTAGSGLDVLATALRCRPDVILLDIMMPGLDGFAACRLLKENEEVKDIPVIMVTAKTEGADIKKALEYGALDYIRKPIDEMEVIAGFKRPCACKETRSN